LGGLLARLAGRTDQDVITDMRIPSTISGGPSIYPSSGSAPERSSVQATGGFPLVAFYQHSYKSHIGFLREGGVCLYDSDEVEPDTPDKRFTYVPVPPTARHRGSRRRHRQGSRQEHVCSGPVDQRLRPASIKLTEIISRQFGGKDESILRNALLAFDAGYAYPLGDILDLAYQLKPAQASGKVRVATDGNTAMSLGLIAAGVRYGAGYPITPWSPIMEQSGRASPIRRDVYPIRRRTGGDFHGTGLRYSGHLAVTGSAGPGLSLKMEALSWATMAELPLIVINVQRGGPSTGLPTSVEQSDLMQAIYGSHGDCPGSFSPPGTSKIVSTSRSKPPGLPWKYSVPVIILSDQALSSRIEAFPEPDLAKLMVDPTLDSVSRPGRLQAVSLDHGNPPRASGHENDGGVYPVVTGLEHDEMGHPTSSPELHMKMTARRRNKLRRLEAELKTPEVYGDANGEILLVGWGSTYGPIREAVTQLREKGSSSPGSICAIRIRWPPVWRRSSTGSTTCSSSK